MPAPIVVRIDTLGELQINRTIERWMGRAGDATPAFAVIADQLRHIEAEQFDSQGASSGSPWAPLAESTLKAKAAAGLDPRILHATLALRDSLTKGVGPTPGSPDQLLVITPSMLAFGSTLPYARMHQKPGSAARYPRRRPIDLTEAQKVRIVKTLQLWIARGIARFL